MKAISDIKMTQYLMYNNDWIIWHSGFDREQPNHEVINHVPEQTVDKNQDEIYGEWTTNVCGKFLWFFKLWFQDGFCDWFGRRVEVGWICTKGESHGSVRKKFYYKQRLQKIAYPAGKANRPHQRWSQ